MFEVLTREAIRFCSKAVRLFPTRLLQTRTALIWDFHQWFCKESARRAVRGHMIMFKMFNEGCADPFSRQTISFFLGFDKTYLQCLKP